jgi:hypothetical protein
VADLTRRSFFLLAGSRLALSSLIERSRSQQQDAYKTRLAPAADEFLEDLSRRSFAYFWDHQSLRTGLVLDRARTDGTDDTSFGKKGASIAATGFGLTALSIAAERGWVSTADARARIRTTLRFFAEHAFQEHGWFYHFMNPDTGERWQQCEVSSIDTGWLLAGALAARQKFAEDSEIVRLGTGIYERVDFPWMRKGRRYLLSDGWTPEGGFLASRYKSYSELMLLYLLGIGSPSHPIPQEAWYAWSRPEITYAGFTFVCGEHNPLFVHQYSQAWLDFRNRRDRTPPHCDYFLNSVKATRAHRAFCLSLSPKFPAYSENVWGITSSDSVHGYVEWGGPPAEGPIDGTVVPSAAGGSLMFAPDICLSALRAMRDKFGERIYGRYGFTNAFNPETGWVDPDVIGIGLGITLLAAENLRTGNVWRWFMSNPEPSRAVSLVLERYSSPTAAGHYTNRACL